MTHLFRESVSSVCAHFFTELELRFRDLTPFLQAPLWWLKNPGMVQYKNCCLPARQIVHTRIEMFGIVSCIQTSSSCPQLFNIQLYSILYWFHLLHVAVCKLYICHMCSMYAHLPLHVSKSVPLVCSCSIYTIHSSLNSSAPCYRIHMCSMYMYILYIV